MSGGALTNDSSLLAHVAWKFTTQTETLATEALGYILSRSAAARQALQETIRRGGIDIGPLSDVRTEVIGKKKERVDLAGFDEYGEERALIEVKFWAGLTENQPGTYLERMPNDGKPAVLLFVAPQVRLETLWPELRARAKAKFDMADAGSGDVRSLAVDGGPRHLMLVSWRELLDNLSGSVDAVTQGDVQQLNALCEQQDSEAFQPLHSEELGPEFPRRMLNLRQLIDDATERCKEKGFVSTSGLAGNTPRPHGYGRYLAIGVGDGEKAGAWFGVNYEHWAKLRETVLWITVFSWGTLIPLAEARRRLGEMILGRSDSIPVSLPVGVESDKVLDAVVERLREVADKVNS